MFDIAVNTPLIETVYILNIALGFQTHLKGIVMQIIYKYIIASTQITNNEIFTFIAVLGFNLLSPYVLFTNRKDNRNY